MGATLPTSTGEIGEQARIVAKLTVKLVCPRALYYLLPCTNELAGFKHWAKTARIGLEYHKTTTLMLGVKSFIDFCTKYKE